MSRTTARKRSGVVPVTTDWAVYEHSLLALHAHQRHLEQFANLPLPSLSVPGRSSRREPTRRAVIPQRRPPPTGTTAPVGGGCVKSRSTTVAATTSGAATAIAPAEDLLVPVPSAAPKVEHPRKADDVAGRQKAGTRKAKRPLDATLNLREMQSSTTPRALVEPQSACAPLPAMCPAESRTFNHAKAGTSLRRAVQVHPPPPRPPSGAVIPFRGVRSTRQENRPQHASSPSAICDGTATCPPPLHVATTATSTAGIRGQRTGRMAAAAGPGGGGGPPQVARRSLSLPAARAMVQQPSRGNTLVGGASSNRKKATSSAGPPECPICQSPAIDPIVASASCGHVFCRLCMAEYLWTRHVDRHREFQHVRRTHWLLHRRTAALRAPHVEAADDNEPRPATSLSLPSSAGGKLGTGSAIAAVPAAALRWSLDDTPCPLCRAPLAPCEGSTVVTAAPPVATAGDAVETSAPSSTLLIERLFTVSAEGGTDREILAQVSEHDPRRHAFLTLLLWPTDRLSDLRNEIHISPSVLKRERAVTRRKRRYFLECLSSGEEPEVALAALRGPTEVIDTGSAITVWRGVPPPLVASQQQQQQQQQHGTARLFTLPSSTTDDTALFAV